MIMNVPCILNTKKNTKTQKKQKLLRNPQLRTPAPRAVPAGGGGVFVGRRPPPSPPAPCIMIQVLRLLRRPTHTPSKAGLVQYASYTTKCPGTTSGLSGKQATHDGVHALPPVGTGPAHKKLFARPEEWRDTFR